MVSQFRFRLTGVSPAKAIKMIKVDLNMSVAEINANRETGCKTNCETRIRDYGHEGLPWYTACRKKGDGNDRH